MLPYQHFAVPCFTSLDGTKPLGTMPRFERKQNLLPNLRDRKTKTKIADQISNSVLIISGLRHR